MSTNNHLSSSAQMTDSFVKDPIFINTHKTITNAHKCSQLSTLSTKYYADYQQFKLTNFFLPSIDDTQLYSKINNNSDAKIIDMATIDTNTLKMEVSNDFLSLMEKYYENDIVFVSVVGESKGGKSFFCDKVLNLAQVNGNHFCRESKPSIKLWSAPFFKDNICIFLTEVTGAPMKSLSYKMLTTLALLLSSSLIYINSISKDNNEIYSYLEVVQDSLSLIDFQDKNNRNTKTLNEINKLLPQLLLNLRRQGSEQDEPVINSVYFQEITSWHLPNAMNKNYTGNKNDLLSLPFLTKQCINEEYIKEVSNIFKCVYEELKQKNYNNLFTNGKIVLKLITNFISYLNINKPIKIHRIYEDILHEFYVSAFNYSILGYHEDLQSYFCNQEPKNYQQMIKVFSLASNKLLTQFNQFKFNHHLHQEYQQKLIQHIDSKEAILLEVNKNKTISHLSSVFSKISFSDYRQSRTNISKLKQTNKPLNHGRQFVIYEKLKEIQGGFIVESMLKSETTENKLQIQNKLIRVKEGKLKKLQQIRVSKLQEEQKQRQLKNQTQRQALALQNKIDQIQSQITKIKCEKQMTCKQKLQYLEHQKKQSLQNFENVKIILKQTQLQPFTDPVHQQKQQQIHKLKQTSQQLQLQILSLENKKSKPK